MTDRIVKIKRLLERSSYGLGPDDQADADPELIAQGWERRFTADAQRAEEVVELYARLGYEVRTEPARHRSPEDSDCEPCWSSTAGFKTIYTRKTSQKA
jgi:hypothetical protein